MFTDFERPNRTIELLDPKSHHPNYKLKTKTKVKKGNSSLMTLT